MYASDNDGYYPIDRLSYLMRPQDPPRYKTILEKYGMTDAQFYCPANKFNHTRVHAGPGFADMSFDSSYMETNLIAKHGQESPPFGVGNPRTGYILFSPQTYPDPSVGIYVTENTTGVSANGTTFYSPHGLKSNSLFLDGHVDFVSENDFRTMP